MKATYVRASLAVLSIGALAGGCLSRPVSTQQPTLKTNFTSEIHQTAVDKLDILFMIDNSASMGDKQAYLQAAIPDLINRLVNPNCVDDNGNVLSVSTNGTCAMGQLEFPPVHDMHLGIISSSLGSRGGDVCPPAGMPAAPYANISDHNDDQAHLLNRSLTISPTAASESTVADATDGTAGQPGYLYWFPSVSANSGKMPGKAPPS